MLKRIIINFENNRWARDARAYKVQEGWLFIYSDPVRPVEMINLSKVVSVEFEYEVSDGEA